MGIRKTWSISVLSALWCLAGSYDSSRGLTLICPPEAGDRCRNDGYSINDHFYIINGKTENPETISFVEGNKFSMSCLHTPLNESALPRFPRRVSFKMVMLKYCVPPDASTSFVAALERLNVTVVEKLAVHWLPAGARLAGVAFADLPASVTELEISSIRTIHLESNALTSLAHIKKLWLERVRPDKLPLNLTLLNLRYTGLNDLPDLPDDLEVLNVVEKSLTDFTPLMQLNNLRELHLSAPLEAVPQLPAGLVNLTLVAVREHAPVPLQRCELLQRLTVMSGDMRPPPGWVAACPRLQHLVLTQQNNLTSLPERLLEGATQLRALHITRCYFKTLPEDLFKYSPNIKVLNLSYNKLETLPSDVFSPLAARLEELDLTYNALSAQGVCAALAPLGALTDLSLARNQLGDLCDPVDGDHIHTSVSSCLTHTMKQSLSRLSLSDTNASRVCADYLRDMPGLRRLDLTDNAVEALTLSELNAMQRDQPSEVDLTGNPLRTVDASEADYDAAGGDRADSKGTILLNHELTCDCTLYWFARALREGRVAVRMEPACSGGARVRSVPPERLECVTPCAPCACAGAPALRGLRAACPARPPAAWLRRLPLPLRSLSLVGAGLHEIPHQLPDGLLFLDLANNSIARDTARSGEAMFAGARSVRLAHNPLACDCAPGSLLPLLRARRTQLSKLNESTCADGRLLAEALERTECGGGGGVAAALAVLGAAAAAAGALAALLTRAEPRLRLKAWLAARGLRARAGERDDRLFDVFLSHAPRDARFVALHLAPALQRKGYKLCLKDRDWPPGAWIPSQIEASVACSRRTLAVVSCEGGAEGGGGAAGEGGGAAPDGGGAWADAELRAAHAASLQEKRSRLIIVCVGEMPPGVRRIARAHVTLRWGAPHFWDRLLYAMPAREPAPTPKPKPAPTHKLDESKMNPGAA